MMDDTYANQDVHDVSPDTAVIGSGISEGTPVFDASGDKVGVVAEHASQGDYFVVRKGLIFTHDLFAPISAISSADNNGVYLNLSKEQINDQGWDQPPVESGSAQMRGRDTTVVDTGLRSRGRDHEPEGLAGHPTPVRDGDIAVPVREEELVASKKRTEAGRVHVHKDVVEEQQTVSVPVTHEEVRVERVPVDERQAADLGPDAFTERQIDVPLMGDRVVTEKDARVAEELHLHKQDVTEQQRVADTVKKERVHIEGADVTDTTARDIPRDEREMRNA